MGGNNVQIRGAVHVAEVDGVAHGLVGIDTVHRRIHEGVTFSSSFVDVAVAGSASVELLIRVVATRAAHLGLSIAVGANAEIEFFQAPTTSADGSALAALNRNRLSATVATTLIFEGPTVSVDGVELSHGLLPGGSGGNANGGQGDSLFEWILAPADYLLRTTNLSGSAAPHSLQLFWYEPPLVA
jgi:hypothetical protein